MSGIKLYNLSDSPPACAVRMLFKTLALPHQLVDLDFIKGEHLSEKYAKINPQREIPCLDDNGFLLNESVAILQYLADKYTKEDALYPRDAQKRAVVNQRLMSNVSTYSKYVAEHAVYPIFFSFKFKQTPESLKKLNMALEIFNTYFQRGGTKYVAGDGVTIADLLLITTTMCLEVIHFPLTPYTLVNKWYETFKLEYPELWAIAEKAMMETREFAANPPDMSGLNHPLHRPAKQ